MRHLKRISFFIYTCLIFAAGFYGHIKFTETFYPGRQPRVGSKAGGQAAQADEPAFVAASLSSGRITGDTMLVIQIYDDGSGSETAEQQKMPGKYIGLDREDFVRCIEDMEASMSLAERSAGLYSIEVLSFSTEKIVLRKSYHKQEKSDSFYLMIEQNMVVVYEQDRSGIYLRTTIDGRELPSKVRYEILHGMTIASKSELEKFLESYST